MYVYKYTGLSRGPVRDPEREFPHTNLSPVEKELPPEASFEAMPRQPAGIARRIGNYSPAVCPVNLNC